MSDLDARINEHFAGFVVRKDLVKAVKGNAIVPTYVLEYLLGQYCATNDAATIQTGIDTVREILRKHYVHRSEAGLIQSTINCIANRGIAGTTMADVTKDAGLSLGIVNLHFKSKEKLFEETLRFVSDEYAKLQHGG